MPTRETRLPLRKTYKLFLGGKFVRGENGRVMTAKAARGKALANYARASRKDFRDAVVAARAAAAGWSKNSAYLRGQILYRAAEMLERRSEELASELAQVGTSLRSARREVAASIERLIYYAGWTDKFTQVFGAVNPVATSHFNFTMPEPTGVVALLLPDEPALLSLVSLVAPAIASGNTVVALVSAQNALAPLTFAEVVATSDIPAGVVNLLSGDRKELSSHFASHMDVNALVDASGDEELSAHFQAGSAVNVKRYRRWEILNYFAGEAESPYFMMETVEMKTAWHPIGL